MRLISSFTLSLEVTPPTLCDSDGSNGRMAEHHRGDVGVVQFGVRLVVKDTMCQLSPCSNCHWGGGGS